MGFFALEGYGAKNTRRASHEPKSVIVGLAERAREKNRC